MLIVPLLREDLAGALPELAVIVGEAQTLALEMFSGPHEFKFNHAEVNENFNAHWMVNRDLSMVGDPNSLMNKQVRVRLGITPTIWFQHFGQEVSAPQLIHAGNVLLRPPPQGRGNSG